MPLNTEKKASSAIRIRKIKKDSPAEQVYEQLKYLINTKAWEPGSRIPSETELASQFGVSRMTVRSATQKLSFQGLLDIQQGNGTYVKERTLESYISGLSSDLDMSSAMSDAFEIRFYLDLAAAEQAIRRASDKEIDQLEILLNKLLRSIKEEPDRFRDYDIEFHRFIYIMSKNQLLLTIFDSIEPLIRKQIDDFDATLTAPDLENGRYAFHSQLFEGIKARNLGDSHFLTNWYKDVQDAYM